MLTFTRLRRLAPALLSLGLLGLGACGGGSGSSSDAPASSSSSSAAGSSSSSSTSNLVALTEVSGWASQGAGTTGGAAALASNIYKVSNRLELLNALANTNSPTYASNQTTAKNEAKIIYITGSIYGTDLGNGNKADLAYYRSLSTNAAKWDWDLYIQSLDTAFMADLNTRADAGDAEAIATKAKINDLSTGRSTVANLQKAQIQFQIPSNTTILGVGTDAKLIDGYFSINAASNIVIRNLAFEAPIDLTATYDNDKQEWNSRYKAISVVTGKQIWIDHCTLSDGSNLDTESLTINGVTKIVQRHDGLLDIEDGSDYMTISYTEFKNHDKTNMVGGSGDGNGFKERDYNRITFSHNRWQDSTQRAPRARFGRFHVYNNHYSGNTDASLYPMSYYIGMGAESRILSEANAFDITGSKASAARVISNLNGYQFKDVGSWYNGAPASADLEAAAKAALEARWSSAQSAATNSGFTLAAYTNELGWEPPYAYTLASSADELREHVNTHVGAGKLDISLPANAGTAASSSSSSAASVCPSDWTSIDTGIVGGNPLPAVYAFQRDTSDLPATAGATYSGGKYTLVSGGALAGAGDGITFAYKKVSGNFTLVAKLESLEVPTGFNAANVVAGVMLRNDMNPRSLYMSMMHRGNNALYRNSRESACANAVNGVISSNLNSTPSSATPVWMRLQRNAQVVTIAYSFDGVTWLGETSRDFGLATTTPLADEVLVGLAGASGEGSNVSSTKPPSTSVFSGVSITQ